MKLANELDGGFGGFGTAGGEIDAAVLEIGRGERQEARCKILGCDVVKLRSVGERELRALCGHGLGDFRNTVADVDDSGLTCGVEKFAPVLRVDPASAGMRGDGKVFAKVARE